MERIKAIIKKNLSGKKVALLFVITTVVYVFMLTVTIPKTMTFSNGLQLLDMMPFGYDLEYVQTLFETLGEEGRKVYLTNQLPIDMIYPLLFGVSYCILIGYFLNALKILDSAFFYLCFLPILAGIADYAENFGTISLLNSFPELSLNTVQFTSVFTQIKSMTIVVFFSVLIFVLLVFGIKTVLRRKTNM